ncbi:hypothetical protein ACFXTH_011467 [Malus domestica]
MKFLWVVLLITLSALGEGNTTPNYACNPNDLKGLSNFKAGIPIDTSGRLAMWGLAAVAASGKALLVTTGPAE